MSFLKYFYKVLLSQEGDNEYSSNHSLAPFLDLLIANSTIDAKVDQPTSYSYLLRMFGRTKAGLHLIEV